MAHPLVDQLRFARSEFWRGLEGLSDEDAERRLPPINSIAWMVGHLAWQERLYWLRRAQGIDGPRRSRSTLLAPYVSSRVASYPLRPRRPR